MPDIAMPPFHGSARKLVVDLGHGLAHDLERYRMFYKQAYGAEVSDADLVREMAYRFMEADREFQVAKHALKPASRSVRRATPAPTPSSESAPPAKEEP
jgi:hypothetical protein